MIFYVLARHAIYACRAYATSMTSVCLSVCLSVCPVWIAQLARYGSITRQQL